LFAGVRLAGPATEYAEPIKQFARNLGVAFQILNDLNDWQGDDHNKLAAGLDTLGGRPTVLWALALEALSPAQQAELAQLVEDCTRDAQWRVSRVRQLYQEAQVFEKADKLIEKHQQRAETIADETQPEELRRLFYYLIDTVLAKSETITPTIQIPAVTPEDLLPIA
jgi:geranylgeranyl pyrophosphate synthase